MNAPLATGLRSSGRSPSPPGPLQVCYRAAAVRRRGSEPAVMTDVALEGLLSREWGEARLAAPLEVLEAPLAAAQSTLGEALWALLPPECRSDLTVEAGWVALTAGGFRSERSYLLATCRGTVLVLSPGLEGAFVSPWESAVNAADLRPDLPVVLGPSATLSLLDHCLELAEGGEEEPPGFSPMLSVLETGRSPYPPHDRPPSLGRGGRRTVVTGGVRVCRNRLDALLLHPEAWLRPLAALATDRTGSLRIRCREAALPWNRALVLEALTPLSSGTGKVEWEAEPALSEGPARAIGAAPMRLRLDPWKIQSQLQGSLSAPRPALIRDPITGDRFGLAPALATGLTAGDLLGDRP